MLVKMASPQPLPQEGGAKALYSILFPLLSWDKEVRGMRPTDLGEGAQILITTFESVRVFQILSFRVVSAALLHHLQQHNTFYAERYTCW